MANLVFTEAALANAERYALFHLADHLLPLHIALASGAIEAKLMFPDTVGLDIKRTIGSIVVIFDAVDGGSGPDCFNKELLDALLKTATGIAVLVVMRDPQPRAWAVEKAMKTGGVVLLVETTDDHAQSWLDCAKHSGVGDNWIFWSSATRGVA